ncbi:exodeoxyribonuclease V subunit alpha [Oceanimonas sp. CHS3-5]|uniref:exodeoxyribonuclease V subunit alpha n=1 Tax=Oceanimonas sp. CHS3-5 TaxID=3068186 RepID=UPI00273FBB0F|nr:exodeoxyribonuclease V subunit alpha [Oceanimonas sp. CHS3-5]MDP5291128.1 exodeoxyribonuclease V subunit alpha [Oceanimonas sp. CHS3-5]
MITTETTTAELLALLDRWVELGWLRPLDRALAGFFAEQQPDADARVLLAAALASHQLGHGHVCLDLAATLAEPDFALSLPPEGEEGLADAWLPSQQLTALTLAGWAQALAHSELVAANGEPERPLVLHGERVYLRRYWSYEQGVARALAARISDDRPVPGDLSDWLERLFPEPLVLDGERQTDWQKLACALAASSGFTLITGGPGTGKTTTVVRLLALLQGTAEQPLRIRLAAPTGKAAARLTESIGAQVASLPVDDSVRAQIPAEVSTLHRLLGSLPGSRHFRHHAGNPLPLDVLVVDEASMIDLEMMHSLLSALPAHARLLLLGDKDQLASVEAGALLGDLCRHAEQGLYQPERLAWLEQVSGERLVHPSLVAGEPGRHGLAQRILMLRYSRRFAGGSGIGRLAEAVNRQQPGLAREQLGGRAEVAAVRLKGEQDAALNRLLHGGRGEAVGYGHYLVQLRDARPAAGTAFDDPAWSDWAKGILTAFDEFRLLCAVRRGPWGVEGLNIRIAGLLHRRGLLEAQEGWYEGRPVLVTRNDYSLGLMNGDIGIALRLPEEDGRLVLRVAFPRNDGSGELRFVLPSRLGEVETVFAMTVHKSQGSEFAHTAMILPEALNPVLTKELLYTGITRARHWFTLLEPRKGVFEQAIARRVERRSGLLESLSQE